MKKILNTTIALFYAFSIVSAQGGHGTTDRHSRRSSSFNQPTKRFICVRRSRSFSQRTIRTSSTKDIWTKSIATVEYMCTCPNPYEFLAVYKGLIGTFEPADIPITKRLIEKIYLKTELDDWTSDEYIKASDEKPCPICFFKINGQILCLAWCGKRSEATAKFSEKLSIFEKLKHIFIFGICGCSTRDVAVGSIFLSKKYVNVQHFSVGHYPSAISRKKILYLFNNNVYFTPPQFFSYLPGETFSETFTEYMRDSAFDIKPAINFSFESFIDDSELAHQIEFRGKEEGAVGIVDLEGARFVALNSDRYTIYSLRVVSDHTGHKIGEIMGGKNRALEVLSSITSSSITIWMDPSLAKTKLKIEDRSIPNFPDDLLPSQLPVIFFTSGGRPYLEIMSVTIQSETEHTAPTASEDRKQPTPENFPIIFGTEPLQLTIHHPIDSSRLKPASRDLEYP